MTPAITPDLDALYQPPLEMVQKAVLDRLVDFHQAYLAQATFFCLATGSARGLDASPRGGPPGFVRVLDPHTVAFADWPGNNRIESLRNLQEDERLGMLFLFPGLEVFMRINGRGRLTTEAALLQALSENGHTPKVATVVQVDEVLMHCGRAINRARLWEESARLERGSLPTVGRILAAVKQMQDASAASSEAEIGQIDAHYTAAVRNQLY
ncbi:pyridoxamine 5'-phosphate oxidase [Azoarcus indigens]|uniref:Pyridoxamine 5'-phosphate oxidase N-terminal domain-containing protein n=1 Tax=Azoarcus indigens TaxID=29545 RepID=A0A4V3BMN4_9RHOO|nr:MSMEG_1061 family FMN-dependent PPOX-type flavoprotein [Azoarcus indigens]NMG66203.1 pyridoxamine 5'-phosphate oxidase [Azoarcus indigens]TDN51332.1 hypothetical protein C7389_10766 [Azoarcus indigens]